MGISLETWILCTLVGYFLIPVLTPAVNAMWRMFDWIGARISPSSSRLSGQTGPDEDPDE